MIAALRTAILSFRARRGMFVASGLAFNFIVGLIPLLFFVISVAGFVLSRKTVMEAVLGQISAIVPVYKSELHDTLAAIIRRRRLSSLLGTGMLLLFSSQLFNAIRL
ncbi:MAG TPA: YhjD/YihY/BrkB family envelope integrity protein, partial [Methylomirabilota bacterium]